MSNNIRAIVIGSTGATGKCLIQELLSSNRFSKVTSIVRKTDDTLKNDKLEQVVVDMENLGAYKELFRNKDAAFCCLGTTRKIAGSTENQKHIELDYSSAFSKLCKEGNVKTMHLVTSQGANKDSWFFYPKLKGEIEEAMRVDNFDSLTIYRPGLLDRLTKDRATFENVLVAVLPSLKVSTLAKSMRIACEKEFNEQDSSFIPPTKPVKIFYNSEIYNLAK
ncbi:putative transcription coactivator [Tieghemostelium lacteum]|uniref:Putative transcription coactivator n=1 Tax=Tieghemostelium lacteum TaxID=361077 RepID=A0A152A3L2_TIELA|nr:putative transcription coactivator [Tieghemostelium lacteum]|eukprot:KYR00799.1 putative transcription coactivator [Tieghemostelium lacteum]